MNTQSSRIRGLLPVARPFALLAFPEANAQKSRGGHSGGAGSEMGSARQLRPTVLQGTANASARWPLACATALGRRRESATAQAPAYNTQARATNAQTRSIHAQSYTNLATAAARRQATLPAPSMRAGPASRTRRVPRPAALPQTVIPMDGEQCSRLPAPTATGRATATVLMDGATVTAGPRATTCALIGRLRSVHANLGADRSRLRGAPRPGDACDLDGHPTAHPPLDGAITAWASRPA